MVGSVARHSCLSLFSCSTPGPPLWPGSTFFKRNGALLPGRPLADPLPAYPSLPTYLQPLWVRSALLSSLWLPLGFAVAGTVPDICHCGYWSGYPIVDVVLVTRFHRCCSGYPHHECCSRYSYHGDFFGYRSLGTILDIYCCGYCFGYSWHEY